MKRDMDLIRLLLLAIEDRPWPDTEGLVTANGYNHDHICYHLRLAADAGLVEGMDMSSSRGRYFKVRRMTWAGHEFLELARDDKRWQRVKAELAKAGCFRFDIATALLTEAVKRETGLKRAAQS